MNGLAWTQGRDPRRRPYTHAPKPYSRVNWDSFRTGQGRSSSRWKRSLWNDSASRRNGIAGHSIPRIGTRLGQSVSNFEETTLHTNSTENCKAYKTGNFRTGNLTMANGHSGRRHSYQTKSPEWQRLKNNLNAKTAYGGGPSISDMASACQNDRVTGYRRIRSYTCQDFKNSTILSIDGIYDDPPEHFHSTQIMALSPARQPPAPRCFAETSKTILAGKRRTSWAKAAEFIPMSRCGSLTKHSVSRTTRSRLVVPSESMSLSSSGLNTKGSDYSASSETAKSFQKYINQDAEATETGKRCRQGSSDAWTDDSIFLGPAIYSESPLHNKKLDSLANNFQKLILGSPSSIPHPALAHQESFKNNLTSEGPNASPSKTESAPDDLLQSSISNTTLPSDTIFPSRFDGYDSGYSSAADSANVRPNSYYSGNGTVSNSKEKDALGKLFESYRDQTNDETDVMGVNGVMQYLQDLGTNMENAEMFVPLEIVKAESIGELSKAGFVEGWKRIGADTVQKQKSHVAGLIKQLSSDMALFKRVYRHAFIASKEKAQKALPLENAIVYWGVLFSPPAKPWVTASTNWGELWTEYLNAKWTKSVNKDMWNQTFEFFLKTLEDETLGFWSEDSAWPGVIDDFVAYAKNARGILPEKMETE